MANSVKKELEELERKVAEWARRLKQLLLKAEDLHGQSEALRRELHGVRTENQDKKNRQP